MNNTALKLSSQEVVNEFKEAHGSLDLLKVYLITGSSDISRSSELIAKWEKNAMNDVDRANFKNALKMLQAIELKRIELTAAIYGVTIPTTSEETTAKVETTTEASNAKEEVKTIVMIPTLKDVQERVQNILKIEDKEFSDTERKTTAFRILKESVGQGLVLGKETWTDEQINAYIDASISINVPVSEGTQVEEKKSNAEPFGFETIYNYIQDMIKDGKEEPEIKELLKPTLIGKIITSKKDDYLIKDDAIFEDYYNRILKNIITVNITAFVNTNKATTDETEKTVIDKKVEEQITPLLQNLDKDEKETSIAPAVKEARTIYESSGIKTSLKEAMTKVKKIASSIAPNLMKRHEGATKSNIPTVEKTEVGAIEIYDDSHNIEETNKPLWAEAKNYKYLGQIFNKGVELSKAGNWRDALSMCILLLSSGNIKEGKKSEETIKWDVDQIKVWYHSNIEKVASKVVEEPETIDAKAEEVKVETKVEETSTVIPEQIKAGPVPQIGTIDSKEPTTRLIKDSSKWKDTYSFKSFELVTDHYRNGKMLLQIVDASPEQEKDLLITESNMTKFFDDQKDLLVENANLVPFIKKTIFEKFSPYYELTASEVKHIVNNLAKEASAIRKVNKIANKASSGSVKNTEEDKLPFTEEKIEVKPTETIPTPEPTKPEVKEEPVVSPPENTPAEEKPKKEKVENEENQSDTTPTQDTVGEKPSSSSSKEMYEGFRDIVKAKQAAEMHKAIYNKVMEYPTQEEGIKAVFEIINTARKDKFFKHSFIRNYKGSDKEAILAKIHKVVETGISLSKNKDN